MNFLLKKRLCSAHSPACNESLPSRKDDILKIKEIEPGSRKEENEERTSSCVDQPCEGDDGGEEERRKMDKLRMLCYDVRDDIDHLGRRRRPTISQARRSDQ